MPGRTAPRAGSIASDAAFTPMTTRSRSVRAITVESEPIRAVTDPLPAVYSLPPTIPRPFTGTLEASLDAILSWGAQYPSTQRIVDTLLRPVSADTDWPVLLRSLYLGHGSRHLGRFLLEELLVLVTRTLLPEQVAENRDALARLYEWRKQFALRFILRYDMLRGWKVDGKSCGVSVASVPPPALVRDGDYGHEEMEKENLEPETGVNANVSSRRPFLSNIIPTLIAAPPGGWSTRAMSDRMKHHVTGLDSYLLLSDEEITAWSDQTLLIMTSQVITQWQWLRQNNELLEDMEVHEYPELHGRADDNEWIADDIKKPDWGKGVKEQAAKTEVERLVE